MGGLAGLLAGWPGLRLVVCEWLFRKRKGQVLCSKVPVQLITGPVDPNNELMDDG